MDVGQLAHSGRIFRGKKTKKQNKKKKKIESNVYKTNLYLSIYI